MIWIENIIRYIYRSFRLILIHLNEGKDIIYAFLNYYCYVLHIYYMLFDIVMMNTRCCCTPLPFPASDDSSMQLALLYLHQIRLQIGWGCCCVAKMNSNNPSV